MGCCSSCFGQAFDGRSVGDNTTQHDWGRGRQLGGGDGNANGARPAPKSAAAQAVQERAARQRQQQAQQQQQQQQQQAKPSAAASSTTGQVLRASQAQATLGGSAALDRAAAAAAAAEERRKEENRGISEETAEQLKVRRQKDDLIGKIRHYYLLAGQEEPFGLGASSLDALKRQLEYAKSLTGKVVQST